MTNYSQVLELDEITLEDCLNLFKTGKIMLIEVVELQISWKKVIDYTLFNW